MSPVATAERETPTIAGSTTPREWARTDEQARRVDTYLAMIDKMYAGADPSLIAALKDTTILSTDDLVALFGYKRKTRVFQLYTDLRELAEADQVPHPSAMPDADASIGHRGARAVRGVTKGQVVHWALQSGRFWWDAVTKQLIEQTGINHGGAARRN